MLTDWGLSQEPVHDVKPHKPTLRMSEGLRDGGENLEAERLPQPDCVLVGLHDRVELHRRVSIFRRNLKDALRQGTSDAPAGYRRRHHEACIGDMTASSWLIRMQLSGSDDYTVIDSD